MSEIKLVDGLNEAIRENPIAATLVGAGVFWMLFGSKVPGMASAISGTANSVGHTLANTGQKIMDTAGAAVADVSARTGAMADTAASTARDAVSQVIPGTKAVTSTNEGLSAAWDSSVETTQRYATQAQQRLSESLERQPLLLGALGLAIGAAVAAAFPRSAIEDEWIGTQGAEARGKLASLASDAKDFAIERGRAVIDEVTQEAQTQGLTPDGVRSGVQDVASKVKNVTGAAREAAARRIS